MYEQYLHIKAHFFVKRINLPDINKPIILIHISKIKYNNFSYLYRMRLHVGIAAITMGP